MKPYPVRFHLYAEDENDIHDLECALYDLVSNCYQDGIYVTASRLRKILQQFGNSPFAKTLFK